MAVIKMDVSEYEELNENKKLLKKTLEEQKVLHEKLIRFEQEKVSALEAASKKVVKIIKRDTREVIFDNVNLHVLADNHQHVIVCTSVGDLKSDIYKEFCNYKKFFINGKIA